MWNIISSIATIIGFIVLGIILVLIVDFILLVIGCVIEDIKVKIDELKERKNK